MNTEEGNKLIAEFMGAEFVNITRISTWKYNGKYWSADPDTEPSLKFHSSWDWLMPVVEKIDSLKCEKGNFIICQSNATSHTFYINYNDGKSTCNCHPKYYDGRHRSENETRIENTFHAVVKFIQWYSTTKPQPNAK